MSPGDSSRKSGPSAPDVYVRMGLEGQDGDFDVLQGYFRQMQTMTVETSMDSDIDLLTFALSAHYFGVVMMKGLVEHPGKSTNVKGDEDLPSEEAADGLPIELDDAELAVCGLYTIRLIVYQANRAIPPRNWTFLLL
jgi:hypothetical protein